ncbi:MAG: tetratricopeptide repeat protein [Phormidesmis sp.]
MQTLENQFEAGIARYKEGESAEALLPIFKDICAKAPKNSAAQTCLSWLYLLADKPNAAFKAAQRAVKLMPKDPQARTNLAIAMLETGKSGVREQVDMVSQMLYAVDELKAEIKENFEEGLRRKPDWQSVKRIQKWLFED